MRSFYIDPSTGDIAMDGQNNMRMVEDDDELVQCIGLTVKTNKKEWFLNPDHGFNRSVVQRKRFDQAEVNVELYDAVLQEDRVDTIEDVAFDYDKINRHLKVDFSFKKQSGETVRGVVE